MTPTPHRPRVRHADSLLRALDAVRATGDLRKPAFSEAAMEAVHREIQRREDNTQHGGET